MKAGAILGPLARFFPTISDASFIGGIEIILTGVLIAVASIVSTYILSELLSALSNFANANTKEVSQPRVQQLPPRAREINSRIGNGVHVRD